MSLAHIPNLISLIRIFLVYPIVVFAWKGQFGLALILFAVACISDLADGYLARRYNWITKVGGWLDPIADKLLLNCLYVTLWYKGLVPDWLLVCILGRDLVIILGVAYYYTRIEKVNAKPTLISKINTFMQLLLVVFILTNQTLLAMKLDYFPVILRDASMYIVLGLTIASGAWYVYIGARRAFMIRKGVT